MSLISETGQVLQRALNKIISARYLITIAVIATLCWAVVKCFDLISLSLKDEKSFSLVKEIIMFVLGAFISVVTNVVTSYFQRNDRVPDETATYKLTKAPQ